MTAIEALTIKLARIDVKAHIKKIDGKLVKVKAHKRLVPDIASLIKSGQAHKVSEDEFMDYHFTGPIESDAYKKMEGGEFDFVRREDFGTLLRVSRVNGLEVEIRLQAFPLKFKYTTPLSKEEQDRLYAEFEAKANEFGTTTMGTSIHLREGHISQDQYDELEEFDKRWRSSLEDIARDEAGDALYMTDEEIVAKGHSPIGYTVGAFVGDKAVGYSGDEFGATGVYVASAYQRHGLGLTLLKTFLEKSGRLKRGTQLGQMTPQGRSLTRALHRALVKDATPSALDKLSLWTKPPEREIHTKESWTNGHLQGRHQRARLDDDLIGLEPHEMTPEQFVRHPNTYWHGTPTGRLGEGPIHVGTYQAAYEALRARTFSGNFSGRADFDNWDPESSPHAEIEGYGFIKPRIFPVWVTGGMTNASFTPHPDFKANGYMAAAVKRGNAKNGYYYENVAEDSGSISAVVPSKEHLTTYEEFQRQAKPSALSKLQLLKPPKTPTDPIKLSTTRMGRKGYDPELGVTLRTKEFSQGGIPYTQHVLTAWSKAQGDIPVEQRAATISWYTAPDDATDAALADPDIYKDTPYIGWVETEITFENQGVATALFQRAQLVTPELKHSKTMSAKARSWDKAMEAAGIHSPNVEPQPGRGRDLGDKISSFNRLALLPTPKTFDEPIKIDLPELHQEQRRKDGKSTQYVANIRHVEQVDPSTGFIRHSLIAELDRDIMGWEYFSSKAAEAGEIGRIEWMRTRAHGGSTPRTRFPFVTWVRTKHEMQDMGIATALWQRAKMLEPKLHHSSDLTKPGDSWIRAMRKAGLKTPFVRNA